MFKTKGVDPITLLLVLVIGVASFMSGFFSPRITKPPPKDEGLIVLEKKSFLSEKGLQIDTLLFGTPTPTPPPPPPPPQAPLPIAPTVQPTPGNYCPKNTAKTPDCECEPGQYPSRKLNCNDPDACDPNKIFESTGQQPPSSCSYVEQKSAGFDQYNTHPGCSPDPQLYCASKPVIYLYPTQKTLVDVKIETPGKVFISDPLYPNEGWKNVEAHPDGTLYYKGEKYRELYYESTFSDLNIPKNGIIIAKKDLKEKLKSVTTKLGLNGFEQKEFLDYWVARLEKLDQPYILFSVLDKKEKERVDHVLITPEPDTRIEFLAYFKPLESQMDIDPLVLPSKIPERIGFTAVEWGGILEN